MILIIVVSLICLVALFPMVYTQPWNIKIALVLFFFAYPVMHVTGFIGLLIMWGLATACIIIPKGQQKV